MCFTGLPLVTLTMTAAVVAYNLRELESWCERAGEGDPTNPLLTIYAAHPLHQRTPGSTASPCSPPNRPTASTSSG